MVWLRSLLFNILFLGLWTPFVCIFFFPALISFRASMMVGSIWAHGTLWLLKLCCNITHEFIGIENIPNQACIFASKHQSAWDTIVFFLVTPSPAYVLKQELCKIPVLGFFLRRMKMIAVKRSDGSKALKLLATQAAKRLQEGRSLVIFPEGTRTALNESPKLHPGIAAIYNHPDVNAPVVPIALNSGLLWGKDSFLKKPGKITMKFLPPIQTGLHRKVFMQQLETQIHEESKKLI